MGDDMAAESGLNPRNSKPNETGADSAGKRLLVSQVAALFVVSMFVVMATYIHGQTASEEDQITAEAGAVKLNEMQQPSRPHFLLQTHCRCRSQLLLALSNRATGKLCNKWAKDIVAAGWVHKNNHLKRKWKEHFKTKCNLMKKLKKAKRQGGKVKKVKSKAQLGISRERQHKQLTAKILFQERKRKKHKAVSQRMVLH